MHGIIRQGWKVEIWCETRSDLIDAPLIALMAKAGVKYIAYGLESVDPVVLKAINKRVDLRQFADVVRATQAAGIEAEVFTLYGLPRQTRDSAVQTLRFLQSLGVKIVGNSSGQQLFLFYGTDVYNNPKKHGIRLLRKHTPLYLSAGADFETDWMSVRDIAFVARKYKAASTGSSARGKECISLLPSKM